MEGRSGDHCTKLGVLITLVGGMLIYDAFSGAVQSLVPTVATISKVTFTALVLSRADGISATKVKSRSPLILCGSCCSLGICWAAAQFPPNSGLSTDLRARMTKGRSLRTPSSGRYAIVSFSASPVTGPTLRAGPTKPSTCSAFGRHEIAEGLLLRVCRPVADIVGPSVKNQPDSTGKHHNAGQRRSSPMLLRHRNSS